MLNELFVEVASMPEFDEDSLNKAKEIFLEYQAKNTLIDCNFEDESWTLSDEYSVTGLNFKFEPFSYRRHYEELFEMDIADFTDNVKVYVCTLLGKYSSSAIRDFLNDIRRIISTNPTIIASGKKDLSLFSVNMCLNFLYMMPNERDYDLIESMENIV